MMQAEGEADKKLSICEIEVREEDHGIGVPLVRSVDPPVEDHGIGVPLVLSVDPPKMHKT